MATEIETEKKMETYNPLDKEVQELQILKENVKLEAITKSFTKKIGGFFKKILGIESPEEIESNNEFETFISFLEESKDFSSEFLGNIKTLGCVYVKDMIKEIIINKKENKAFDEIKQLNQYTKGVTLLKSLCQSSDEDFSEFNKFISEFDSYFITKFFPSSNEDQTEISENNGETEEDEEKKDEKESGNNDETEDKPEQNEHKTNTPTTFETNNISPIKAKETYNRIANGLKFYSPSKGRITRGVNKYKHVCSTGSWNVLHELTGKPLPKSLECALGNNVRYLEEMGLHYIGEVNPKDPSANGYIPQNGDTAVWPHFQLHGKTTQHQATYCNGKWISDTIQEAGSRKDGGMSCYYNVKNEPMCKVYRYSA